MFESLDLPDRFTIHLLDGPFDGLVVTVAGRHVPPWWIYVIAGTGGGRPMAFHPEERPPAGAEMYSLGARHNDGSYTARHHGTIRRELHDRGWRGPDHY